MLSFATTPDGILYAANGVGDVLKWDSLTDEAERVGVTAPTTAPFMSSSGTGNIVGTYFAYLRFLDRNGHVSNISPVSPSYTPISTAGSLSSTSHAITNAQTATATVVKVNGFNVTIDTTTLNVTAVAHGLPVHTFQYVQIASVGGTTEANGIHQVVVLDVNTVNLPVRFVNTYTSGGTLTQLGNAIENASNAAPIVITTTGHGLTNGQLVKVDGVGGNTTANGTWTVNVLDADTFELNGSIDNGTYNGGGVWITGVSTLTYSNLEVPTDAQITRRQILRNQDGSTTTYYVDIDTDDLSSTSLSTTTTDLELQDNVAVPLLDVDGTDLAINRFGVPPNWKPFVAHSSGRMFLAGEWAYDQGMVQVTFGSTTVTGIGTEFLAALEGRFLNVVGADKPYEIDSVNATLQTLTLTEAYLGPTDLFAVYSIVPDPDERRLIWWSEAGFPDAWPPVNSLELQEDGDDITGLMVQGSYLYILERRNIYRWNFESDPGGTDAAPFHAVTRGCINNRCWVVVAGASYMLDADGIHKFDGGYNTEPISAILDVFDADSSTPINWRASKWFHAVHSAAQHVIRWFVALSGATFPRHALCYNYQLNRWWIEEYPWKVGASCPWPARAAAASALTGGEATTVWSMWAQPLDGPSATNGTVRGTVTSSTVLSVTDTAAVFPSSGVVNAPLRIVDGTGKGQTRRIVSVSSTTLNIETPWLELPDTTSTYQIGGVEWDYRTGWFRFVDDEQNNTRRIETIFQPTTAACLANQRVYTDFSGTASVSGNTIASSDNDGVRLTEDDADMVIDLTKETGLVQVRLDGHKELFTDGTRFIQLGMGGTTNADVVKVYGFTIDGVKQ